MKRIVAGVFLVLALAMSACGSHRDIPTGNGLLRAPMGLSTNDESVYLGSSVTLGGVRRFSKTAHYEVEISLGEPFALGRIASKKGRYVIEGEF